RVVAQRRRQLLEVVFDRSVPGQLEPASGYNRSFRASRNRRMTYVRAARRSARRVTAGELPYRLPGVRRNRDRQGKQASAEAVRRHINGRSDKRSRVVLREWVSNLDRPSVD